MRGTHHNLYIAVAILRFIPACAGNTLLESQKSIMSTVHPRVCGEHLSQCRFKSFTFGSSPRVRGTPDLGGGRPVGHRFIPACAGNTANGKPLPTDDAVHPRVCGEHPSITSFICSKTGSSPRVRGTLPMLCCPVISRRFIPACAGNTSACAISFE